jgi:hypothetical protein
MRKLLSVMVLVVITGLTTPLLAGPSIFAGVSAPMGDLGDRWKIGYHGGAQYLCPVTPLGSIGIRGAYNRFSPDEVGGVTPDGHLNMVEVLAVGQISLVAGPRFIAGLGLTRYDGESGVAEIKAESDFTAMAGVGMSFVAFEVTALYHSVASEGNASNYVTLSAGLGF